jgi:hypothetical protein
MSDFITSTVPFEGENYELQILTGTVIDANTRSDTHVSGGGNNNVGVNISSYVTVTNDVWVKGISGQEYQFRLGNVAVRPGNIVEVFIIQDEVFYFVNRTIDKQWHFGKYPYIKAAGITYKMFILPLMATFITFLFAQNIYGLIFAFLFGLSITLSYRYSMSKEIAFTFAMKSFWPVVKEQMRSLASQRDEIATQLQAQATRGVKEVHGVASTKNSFCSSCGKPLVPGAKFCAGCGTNLVTAS